MIVAGTTKLLSKMLVRSPPAIILMGGALALGPALALVRSSSPIPDGAGDLAPAWIQALAILGASQALWAIAKAPNLRRALRPVPRALEDALMVALTTIAYTGAAAISLSLDSSSLPWELLLLAPLKVGALASLSLILSPGRNLVSLTVFWCLALGLGQLFPSMTWLGLPLEPALWPQVISTLGILLIAGGLAATPRAGTWPAQPCDTQS